MTEMRIHSAMQCKTGCAGAPAGGGLWHPDSPRNREMLKIILESCIEIHGVGEHWVEVRDL